MPGRPGSLQVFAKYGVGSKKEDRFPGLQIKLGITFLGKRIGWVNQAGELPNLHHSGKPRAASQIPVRRTGKPPLTCRKTRNRTRSVAGPVVPDVCLTQNSCTLYEDDY
jgi:hypothetical protein